MGDSNPFSEYLLLAGLERFHDPEYCNGGLLMGATLTQRPDLFRAAICQVPPLDMLRYQNFR